MVDALLKTGFSENEIGKKVEVIFCGYLRRRQNQEANRFFHVFITRKVGYEWIGIVFHRVILVI